MWAIMQRSHLKVHSSGEDGASWPTQCMQETWKTSFLQKSDLSEVIGETSSRIRDSYIYKFKRGPPMSQSNLKNNYILLWTELCEFPQNSYFEALNHKYSECGNLEMGPLNKVVQLK